MIGEVNGTHILRDDETSMELDREGFLWLCNIDSEIEIHLSNDMLEALRNYLNKYYGRTVSNI